MLSWWNTIKRVFGGDAAQNSAASTGAPDLTTFTDAELVSMNQELARAQDAIRDQRRDIKAEIQRRDAVVRGQTLTVDVEN